MRIAFLHGTETGTAEIVCEDVEAEVKDRGETSIASLEDTHPADLDGDSFYIIVCSTFGSGDLPTTAEVFFETLEKEKPDLSHVRFAMFGLGDRTFGETFAEGSERLMNAMIARGATLVGERGIADASSGDMPDEIALEWLRPILDQVSAPA